MTRLICLTILTLFAAAAYRWPVVIAGWMLVSIAISPWVGRELGRIGRESEGL